MPPSLTAHLKPPPKAKRTQVAEHDPPIKICYRCGRSLPPTSEFFYRDSSRKDGLSHECKSCTRERNKAYAAAHDEEITKRKRIWRESKRLQREGERLAYEEEHEEEIEAAKRQREELRQEKKRAKDRRRYHKDPEKMRAKAKERYETNKTIIYQRRKQRLAKDPTLRLSRLMSERIRNALKGNKSRKHWEDLVGYTVDELRSHLESQFQPGMNWNNHTHKGWHIDHIIPESSYHFESYDDPQFRECWSLSNLRPLWAEANFSKGCRLPGQTRRPRKAIPIEAVDPSFRPIVCEKVNDLRRMPLPLV